MITGTRLTARPLTARPLTALRLGETDSQFSPMRLFSGGETGTFLDFTTTQVYADTGGTDPAEVGEGIAFTDDKSPNDTDSTQATSTARPIFGRVPRGGRRNLLTYTEDFSNAAWAKNAATVTPHATNAPNGTITAGKLVEITAASLHYSHQGTNTTAGTYTYSAYMKAAGRTWAWLYAYNASTTIAYFDLTHGVVGTVAGSSPPTATITPAGNGWYRCSIAVEMPHSNFHVGFGASSGDNISSYTGDGASGIYIWGAQVETGSTATPYQKVVTQYDITEAGVPSVYKSFFDGVDDILPITLPTITGGTVALIGLNGIWIEENWDFTAGTLNIGPTGVAGLPAGILDVVGDLCAVVINDRAWTAVERAGVIAWGKARMAV